MVPIHESDVAENRWKDSEWNSYELWEAVELRERRRKLWMIGLSCFLGLFILALPIYKEKSPKWDGLQIARRLADRLLDVRRDASHAQKRFLVKVSQDNAGRIIGQVYSDEAGDVCAGSQVRELQPVFTFPVVEDAQDTIQLITPDLAVGMGLSGVDNSICFDPLLESSGDLKTFAFIPVKDLTVGARHRISTLAVLDAASFSFD